MKKEDFDSLAYAKLMDPIMPALMKNGLKATTMDSIAASLQMSKRTLYEIFGSKEEMFGAALKIYHSHLTQELISIFESSSNVMEAIIKCFLYHRDLMSNVSAEFIRDTQEFLNRCNMISQDHFKHHYQNLYEVLLKGVKEGYFRDDVNLKVQCRMLAIQMEALKRTEELFPEDISLVEVYNSIILGFLRGISAEKGLHEIDRFLPSFALPVSNSTSDHEN